MKASRIFMVLAALCLFGCLLSGCGSKEENVLKLYNYGDYMSDELTGPVIAINKYIAANKGARIRLENPPVYKPKKRKKKSPISMIGG